MIISLANAERTDIWEHNQLIEEFFLDLIVGQPKYSSLATRMIESTMMNGPSTPPISGT